MENKLEIINKSVETLEIQAAALEILKFDSMASENLIEAAVCNIRLSIHTLRLAVRNFNSNRITQHTKTAIYNTEEAGTKSTKIITTSTTDTSSESAQTYIINKSRKEKDKPKVFKKRAIKKAKHQKGYNKQQIRTCRSTKSIIGNDLNKIPHMPSNKTHLTLQIRMTPITSNETPIEKQQILHGNQPPENEEIRRNSESAWKDNNLPTSSSCDTCNNTSSSCSSSSSSDM